jgi:hypothetical protein
MSDISGMGMLTYQRLKDVFLKDKIIEAAPIVYQ